MAATRTLQVVIAGDSKGAEKAFKDLEAASSTAEAKLAKIATGMKSFGDDAVRLGKSLALNVSLPITALGAVAFRELADSQKVAAQTEAAIRSTGGAANVTAKDVDRLATALMNKSGVDDEAIASGENLLLTFTRIRNEAGKGNAIFNRATKAALDLSIAFGTDMHSASIMLGKALNDPIAGLTSLGRAGVQFTADQKETIKALVASGDVLGAQKMILKELEIQVGGSAKAYGETLPGQIAKAKESLINSSAAILGVAAPAIGHMAKAVESLAGFLMNLPGPAKEAVAAFAAFAAVSGPVVLIVGKLAQGGALLVRGFSAAAGAAETLSLRLMYAKEALIALAMNPEFLLLAGIAVALGAVALAVHRTSDEMDKGAEAGRKYGEAVVLHAQSSAHQIALLRKAVHDLNYEYAVKASREGESAGLVGEYAAAHDKVTGALRGAIRAHKEAEAAERARRDAIQDVVNGTTDLTNTTDDARNAIMALQSQILAASGGELGYQQAVINSQKAQDDLNTAIAEHGPFSAEAAAASLNLQQAQLQGASAALGLDDAYLALKTTLLETPEAYDAEIAKLEESKRKHPEFEAIIQSQIDKLVFLKGTLESIPEQKNTRVDADTEGATRKLADYSAQLGRLPSSVVTSIFAGIYGGMAEGAGATGAVINRPTLALIGEAGPEMLTPLNQTPGNGPLPGGMGGDLALTIVLDGAVIAKAVEKDFNRRAESGPILISAVVR